MALTFNNSLKSVANQYIQILNAKVTRTSVFKDIEENPFYPSLLALSDTFSRYNINNAALQISHQDLWEIQPPFIAYVKLPDIGKDFVLVTEISGENVKYIHREKKANILSRQKFNEKFQKIVWIAEVG